MIGEVVSCEGIHVKCLSVCQPWAWAIIFGRKRIENRARRTTYRGPILIHASRSQSYFRDHPDVEWWRNSATPPMPDLPNLDQLDYGMAIGVIDVVDCVPYEDVKDRPFAIGPWCWLLQSPRWIVPFPLKGNVSLFEVDDRLIQYQ